MRIAFLLFISLLTTPFLAMAQLTITDVQNLGLFAVRHQLEDGRLVFRVLERGNDVDLNGDGDTLDPILHVFRIGDTAPTNLGLAEVDLVNVANFQLQNGLLAFIVHEGFQGVDLNGDGEVAPVGQNADLVLHTADLTAPSIVPTNLGIDAKVFTLDAGVVAFTTREAAQDVDINGDGDKFDQLAHWTTIGIPGITNFLKHSTRDVTTTGGVIVIPIREQIGEDLNGDNDHFDTVLFVQEPGALAPRNLGIAGGQIKGFNGSFAFMDDRGAILHIYDGASRGVTNVGLRTLNTYVLNDSYVAFPVEERFPAAGDLNGDGDTRDDILHVYDRAAGMVRNTGLDHDIQEPLAISGNLVAVRVIEHRLGSVGGQDLNNDGDITSDRVLHLYDAATNTTQNLGLEASIELEFEGNLLAFSVSERNQGDIDLNGDGDALDAVLHVHDTITGISTNLGVSVFKLGKISGQRVAFKVQEDSEGVDLNGDGDMTLDRVAHVYDHQTGQVINLGYATADGLLPQVDGDWVAFTVRESRQGGMDFNGDGVANDDVMHIARIAPSAEVLLQKLIDDLQLVSLPQFWKNILTGVLNAAAVALANDNIPAVNFLLNTFIGATQVLDIFFMPPGEAAGLVDTAQEIQGLIN